MSVVIGYNGLNQIKAIRTENERGGQAVKQPSDAHAVNEGSDVSGGAS